MDTKKPKPRRSKEKKNVAEAMRKQLERIEAEAQQELESEIRLLEEKTNEINTLCAEEELFCGIIITPDDVLQIIKIAIETKENIKIPFRLYFNN